MGTIRKNKPAPPNFIGHYAGFVTRLIAFVIDIVIVTLFIGAMWGTLSLLLGFFNLSLIGLLSTIAEAGTLFHQLIVFLTGFGFTFIVALVYNVFFWMFGGKTLGKAVMGVRVIGPQGARMTFWRSVRRYLGYWLAALPFFLGFLWVLITDERIGWHDKIARTHVIYDHEAQYSQALLGNLPGLAPKLEAKFGQKTLAEREPSES